MTTKRKFVCDKCGTESSRHPLPVFRLVMDYEGSSSRESYGYRLCRNCRESLDDTLIAWGFPVYHQGMMSPGYARTRATKRIEEC
jgi:hypothetical protein